MGEGTHGVTRYLATTLPALRRVAVEDGGGEDDDEDD